MDLRQYAATQAEAVPVPPAPPPPLLAREQAQEAQDALREAEVYKRYQEATKTSEQARTAITKGLQAGLNPYRLLLIATDCIGKLTAGGCGGPTGAPPSLPGNHRGADEGTEHYKTA